METQKNPRGNHLIRSGDAWQESVLEYTQYRVPARPGGKIIAHPALHTFYPPPLRVTNPPVEIAITPDRPFPAQHWLTDFSAPAQYALRLSPSLHTYVDVRPAYPHFFSWLFSPILSPLRHYLKKHSSRRPLTQPARRRKRRNADWLL